MASCPPRKLGRPPIQPRPAEKATLNVRASPALKHRLLMAAERADRSLSAEMEVRLEMSFRGEVYVYDPVTETGLWTNDLGDLWVE